MCCASQHTTNLTYKSPTKFRCLSEKSVINKTKNSWSIKVPHLCSTASTSEPWTWCMEDFMFWLLMFCSEQVTLRSHYSSGSYRFEGVCGGWRDSSHITTWAPLLRFPFQPSSSGQSNNTDHHVGRICLSNERQSGGTWLDLWWVTSCWALFGLIMWCW